MPPQPNDLTGQTFGRWTVVGYSHSNRGARWFCICDCGIERVVMGSELSGGRSQSCGCLRNDDLSKRSRKHGHTLPGRRTREYTSWSAMKYRTSATKGKYFRDYVSRGIRVCERWRSSFEAFLEDMGPRPAGMSLDRIDNNGNYEPGNCRWADDIKQRGNRRPMKSRKPKVSNNV